MIEGAVIGEPASWEPAGGVWRALSLTRPWPYTILQLGKRIENRQDARGAPPMCSFRGPLLLHSAKGWDKTVGAGLDELGLLDSASYAASSRRVLGDKAQHPPMAIVGRCRVVGHVEPFECDRCDGCGWWESSPSAARPGPAGMGTSCESCRGTGRIPRFVMGPPEAKDGELFRAHITLADRRIVTDTPCGEGFATELDKRWWHGGYGLLLDEVQSLARPVPCVGHLGLWKVPAEVVRACSLPG